MRLHVGSYRFPVGQCGCRPRLTARKDRRGVPYCQVSTLAVEGTLIEADSQAIKAALADMKAALEGGTGDIVLYDNLGRKTGINLTAADAVGRIITLDKLWFEEVNGTQWENYLDFKFEVTAEYALAGVRPGQLIDYQETFLKVGNGGPHEVQQEVLTGPSLRVRLVEQSSCEAVQAGQAVGFGGYPRIPPPLFPRFLQNKEHAVTYFNGTGYMSQEYRVSWQYRFTSPRPLNGLPNTWR